MEEYKYIVLGKPQRYSSIPSRIRGPFTVFAYEEGKRPILGKKGIETTTPLYELARIGDQIVLHELEPNTQKYKKAAKYAAKNTRRSFRPYNQKEALEFKEGIRDCL